MLLLKEETRPLYVLRALSILEKEEERLSEEAFSGASVASTEASASSTLEEEFTKSDEVAAFEVIASLMELKEDTRELEDPC